MYLKKICILFETLLWKMSNLQIKLNQQGTPIYSLGRFDNRFILSHLLYCLSFLLYFFLCHFKVSCRHWKWPFTSNYSGIHLPKNNQLLLYHHNSVIPPKKSNSLLIYKTQFMCKSPLSVPKYHLEWLFWTQDPIRFTHCVWLLFLWSLIV